MSKLEKKSTRLIPPVMLEETKESKTFDDKEKEKELKKK